MDTARNLVAGIGPPLRGRVVFVLVALAGIALAIFARADHPAPAVVAGLLFVAAILLRRLGASAGESKNTVGRVPVAPITLTNRVNTMSGANLPAGGVVDSLGYPRGLGPRDSKTLR